MAFFDAVRTSDVGSNLKQDSLLAIFTVKDTTESRIYVKGIPVGRFIMLNRVPAPWLRCKLQREGDYSYFWTFFLSVSLAFILDKRLMIQ